MEYNLLKIMFSKNHNIKIDLSFVCSISYGTKLNTLEHNLNKWLLMYISVSQVIVFSRALNDKMKEVQRKHDIKTLFIY